MMMMMLLLLMMMLMMAYIKYSSVASFMESTLMGERVDLRLK